MIIDESWKNYVLSQKEIDTLIEQLIPGWEAPVMKVLSEKELENLLNALSETECDCKFSPDVDDEIDLDEVLKFFSEDKEIGLPLRYEDGNYYRFSFEEGLIPCDAMNDPENKRREKH